MEGICELCKRIKELSFHHYIPKTLHSKKFFVKLYTKIFMKKYGIDICDDCRDAIHTFWSEKDLAEYYNSKEKLLSDERFYKYIIWLRKQK